MLLVLFPIGYGFFTVSSVIFRSTSGGVLQVAAAHAVVMLLVGCAAHSLETRKKERQAAYAGLPAEQRNLVDQQKIDVGLSTNAVYIAWGAPSQVVRGLADRTFGWIYQCTYNQEYREWRLRPESAGLRRGPLYSTLDYHTYFYPRTYICGEVIFEDNAVKSWRVYPRPEP